MGESFYFRSKIRRLMLGAGFQARSKRYISCDQYRRTCLNLQPDSSIVLVVRAEPNLRIAFVRLSVSLARLASTAGPSLLRYLIVWLRFGVIALAARSFERRAMSHRSVISNYTR